jgi:BTB/POZ domain-containing protein KCTD9
MSSECRNAPLHTTNQQINLRVGERQFSTTQSTLVDESPFFASLLSERWNNDQGDGVLVVDADGELFEHILRYLRRGVLPIFYDASKGHDHGLYLALLEEARYFQITRLIDWLGKKLYLQAIKIETTVDEAEGLEELHGKVDTDCEISYYPVWKKEKVYVCPRDIDLHRGRAFRLW